MKRQYAGDVPCIDKLKKLVSFIENEYDFANFAYRVHANDVGNFKDEKTRYEYALYAFGRLEFLTDLMNEVDKLCPRGIDDVTGEP